MRAALLLLLIQSVSAAGLPPNPRFTEWGTPIPARTGLKVIWNAPTNSIPSTIWVYRLSPRRFSPEVLSNLIDLCSFTEKDTAKQDSDGVAFRSADNSRRLDVSFTLGSIEYQITSHYSHTNLAEDVPDEGRMPELTTNVLQKIGISLSDIAKTTNGAPNFHFWQPLKMYYVNHSFVTNIEFRGARFQRSVDGVPFVGLGAGGDGEIDFGEHGKISKIDLSWRNVERYRAYPTISPDSMMKLIRKGVAVHGPIRIDVGEINWQTIKSVTVSKAKLCYYAGDPPSDWLFPFAALWTTVDTDSGNIEMEIDCPIFDESTASKQ